MRRREFITLVGGAAAAWPTFVVAQQSAMSRIGVVLARSENDPVTQEQLAAFREGLQKSGWSEGRNLAINVRYAKDDPSQIRALAVELLAF